MILYLYSTLGCHLCELAKAELWPALTHRDLRVQEVDISESDDLLERYGVRIPVLRVEGHLLELQWPFDTAGVEAFLRQVEGGA